MPTAKLGKSPGLPAKFLILPALIILFSIYWFGLRQFLGSATEYKKDQAYLTAVMAGKLPDNPAPSVKLPVRGYLIPAASGMCMVDAGAGIANYLEPDIDFDDFVLLGTPTLISAARNQSERYGPGGSFTRTFINLGYTPFRGATTPIHPPQNVNMDIAPTNLIYFKTKEEELLYLKRLLTANIVPIVTFTRDPFKPIEGGLFSSLVGYDNTGVWVNVSPPSDLYAPGKHLLELPQRYDPRHLTYDQFFKYWTPDHQLLWFVKTGPRTPEAEIYAVNKRYIQEAPANLRATIDFLKSSGDLREFSAPPDVPVFMVLYRYFKNQGNLALANEYLKLAQTYESLRQSQAPPTPNILLAAEEDRQQYIQMLEAAYQPYLAIAALWP